VKGDDTMGQMNRFIPEGVEDTHSDKYEIKESTIMKMKKIFKSYGYRQILTPTFEYYDLFSEAEGTIDKDEMFKIIDGNGKILVLRPDVTTPIARMAATNYKYFPGYLKFSYATNIFRIHDQQNVMKREFTQTGIEYLGNSKPDCDAEVISLAIECLKSCGLEDFQIDLGQAKYFKGLMQNLVISQEERIQIRMLIENKNFVELEQLLKRLKIDPSFKNKILEIPHLYGSPDRVVKAARKHICNPVMEAAIENLDKVYQILKAYGYSEYLTVDLGLIHHINYYTGVIFKGYVNHYGKTILSGGRYDHLTKQYGSDMPATGFGLNVDQLLEAMKLYDIQQDFECSTDYLVLYTEKNRQEGLKLCNQIREKGWIVESDLLEDCIEIDIKNAIIRNIRNIIQVDKDEIEILNVKTNKRFKNTFSQFLENLHLNKSSF
jgi:ATP phosphoribosyltransferase regulatory subunit